MLARDVELPATHVQRPRLRRKGSDCAEGEEASVLTHDHRWTGFTVLQRCIDWAEVHPSDFRVDPVGDELALKSPTWLSLHFKARLLKY